MALEKRTVDEVLRGRYRKAERIDCSHPTRKTGYRRGSMDQTWQLVRHMLTCKQDKRCIDDGFKRSVDDGFKRSVDDGFKRSVDDGFKRIEGWFKILASFGVGTVTLGLGTVRSRTVVLRLVLL